MCISWHYPYGNYVETYKDFLIYYNKKNKYRYVAFGKKPNGNRIKIRSKTLDRLKNHIAYRKAYPERIK